MLLWVNVARPSWGAHNDGAVWASLNPIAYWKESVESVDEVRMSIEQLGNSFNYPRRVNPVCIGGTVTCQGRRKIMSATTENPKSKKKKILTLGS
jgi:hypothetical protein